MRSSVRSRFGPPTLLLLSLSKVAYSKLDKNYNDNLDAKLRVQMRSEIAKIHKSVGATTIYVTHDQTEAMTMTDRIVIMNKGYIQQICHPKGVYNHPQNNMLVAGFIESPAINFLKGKYGKSQLVINGENLFPLNFQRKILARGFKQYEISIH